MKSFQTSKFKTVVVLLLISCISISFAGLARAESLDFNFTPPLAMANNDFNYQVALNSTSSTLAIGANLTESTTESGGINYGVLHKYLGYGTLLFAAAAAATGSSGNSFHKAMGHTTTGMAALTTTAGLIEYADDIEIKDGFTFTNIHALLGSIATVGFIVNSADADDDGHSGIAIASGVLAFGGGIIIHF